MVSSEQQSSTAAARKSPRTTELEARIASIHGVEPARVLVTNGGDDAIDRVCKAFLEPGRTLLTHTPSFEMIARSARLAGGSVREVVWATGQFPTQEFLSQVSKNPKSARSGADPIGLLAVVTPNNPTGSMVSNDELIKLVQHAGHAGIACLIDLAYVEFADEDPTRRLLAEPNTVVVRTFSKAFGLASARVGYTIASTEIALALRAAGGPFPVATTSLEYADRALDQRGRVLDRAAELRACTDRVREVINQSGGTAEGSQANFVLARFSDSDFVHKALQSLGVSVRSFQSRPYLEDALRITIPMSDANQSRLEQALECVLNPQALLLDVDGVIADVSDSYRVAILQTARSFGVNVTPHDIEVAKASGNANNDWKLTQQLCQARGIEVDFDAVVQRFQELYVGQSDGSGGLRERETLIPDRATLERLASKLPLAVVTGRPREEAGWFLQRFNISHLFHATVCMEDADSKPSPAPVQLALERLSVKHAWMVGDTPDDVIAARAAGVVPFGVVAPGSGQGAERALQNCGIAQLLTDLSEIESRLP